MASLAPCKQVTNAAVLLTLLLACSTVCVKFATATITPGSFLSPFYYDFLCPNYRTSGFQHTVQTIVDGYVTADPTLPPSLLRMAFHDSFVRGADGSVLINSTANNTAEKDGLPNANSLRGFFVIDAVKAGVEKMCRGKISCADIVQEVALAAMKVNQPNNYPQWTLLYGRRDGRISLASETVTNLPSPFSNYSTLVSGFAAKGLNPTDLAVLSGAHTFGQTHCVIIFNRLYNFTGNNDTDPALDPTFANALKQICHPDSPPTTTLKLDQVTPNIFDNVYYQNILNKKVLFTSDDELKHDTTGTVTADAAFNPLFINIEFPISMKKLSEVQVMLYPQGEIRSNCAVIL